MRNTGLYQLMAEINTRLKNAGFLVVSFGDEPEYAGSKNIITPAAHITPLFFTMNQSQQTGTNHNTFTFELFAYGELTFYKNEDDSQKEDPQLYGDTNMWDVVHETQRLVNIFVNQITQKTIRLKGGFARVSNSQTFNVVQPTGTDDVVGLLGQIEIQYFDNTGNCG